MKYIRKFRTLWNILKIRLKEKSYGGGKFIFYSRQSDSLLICFSAFPPTNLRLYNNIRGFSDFNVDRLYIADVWGYRGSYYLRENGEDTPYRITCSIIEKVLMSGNYRHVYTAGTSKGGTAAIIYGLKYDAECVFAGACQFYVGNWLKAPVHRAILDKMRGRVQLDSFVELMNEFVKKVIIEHQNSDTVIHLVYSKKEHTYQNDIVALIEELKRNNIRLIEIERFFEEHNDVGYAFVPYVQNWFLNNNKCVNDGY